MVSIDRKSSVSVRIPNSMLDMMDNMVEDKKYLDRSEAIRSLIQDGTHLRKIIALSKDPDKSKELVEKITQVQNLNSVKQTMETMEPHQLQLVQSIAQEIRDSKVQQTLMDMKE